MVATVRRRIVDDKHTSARIPVPSLDQLRARTLAASSQHPSAQIKPAEAALSLAVTPQSPKLARTFSAAVLAGRHSPGLNDTATLLVSELVTNALLHANTPLRLELRLDDATVRIDVLDESALAPTLRRLEPEAEGGRGLVFVKALSDRWGWSPTRTGKRVWFELDTP